VGGVWLTVLLAVRAVLFGILFLPFSGFTLVRVVLRSQFSQSKKKNFEKVV